MREKDLGIWQTWSWAEVAGEVRAMACGLAARGFKRGDRLAIIGDNRPRLYWSMAAVQCLDTCVGRIVAALDKVGGEALITADHGNVEQMEDKSTGQAHTAHTCEPVPFIYVGKRPLSLREGGVLADVAPTLLTLLGLPQPTEMTGKSIISLG